MHKKYKCNILLQFNWMVSTEFFFWSRTGWRSYIRKQLPGHIRVFFIQKKSSKQYLALNIKLSIFLCYVRAFGCRTVVMICIEKLFCSITTCSACWYVKCVGVHNFFFIKKKRNFTFSEYIKGTLTKIISNDALEFNL